MKKKKRKNNELLEYIALRSTSAFLTIIPQKVVNAIAWIGSLFLFHVIRFKRIETPKRIFSAIGCDKASMRNIMKKSTYRLCLIGIESMRMTKRRALNLANQPAGISFAELYKQHKAQFGDKGFIVACPHMGCWEQVGLAGSTVGVPAFFMAKQQKNKRIDKFINDKRKMLGTTAIASDTKMLRQIVERLNRGEGFFILPDISEKRKKSLQIKFLNGTANVNAGTAMFAKKADVPIYPICPIFKKNKHQIISAAPILPDENLSKEEDYQRIMQQIFDFYDEQIKKYPEQYFWYNKRWILEPPRAKKNNALKLQNSESKNERPRKFLQPTKPII